MTTADRDLLEAVQMSHKTAQRYMAVWSGRVRLNGENGRSASTLPASWMTLYALQALPDDTLAWALAERKVTP